VCFGGCAEDAYAVLGLSPKEAAGFDTIMEVKNKLMAANGGNQEKLMQVRFDLFVGDDHLWPVHCNIFVDG